MMKHRIQLIPITLFALLISVTACSDSGTDPGDEFQVETNTAEDVPANPDAERGAPADYTFYDLEAGAIISDEDSASTEWDLAFSGLNILVNSGTSGPGDGGAVVLDVAFDQVSMAPSEGYVTDAEGEPAINGWYNYTGQEGDPAHAVLPVENKTIVLKTGDGEQYAKVRIISYYKGNPDTSTEKFSNLETRPPSRYYTFEYAIQMNGSREFVEQ